jgi:hypothetical protein
MPQPDTPRIHLNEHISLEDREHWGIVLSSREPIHVLFRRLLKLLQTVPAHQLKNQVRWLNEFN